MTGPRMTRGDETFTVQHVSAGESLEIRVVRADATASDGSNAARVWRFAKRPVEGLVATFVALFIGAVISDRYSDRQRELELESDLIKQISRDVIVRYQGAQDASRADSFSTQRVQREQAADAWVLASGSITPVFRVYYDGQPVSAQWGRYQEAMYTWTRLGCCTSDEERRPMIAELRS